MAEHPIQGLMKTAMENLKEMIDVNTIVGDPVETPDGSVILPISRVGFGFAAGGTEFEPNGDKQGGTNRVGGDQSGNGYPFGGGSGGGVSITPVAFLVVGKNGIKSISLEGQTHIYEKILELAPQALDKIEKMAGQMGKQSGSKNGKDGNDQEKNPKQEPEQTFII
ncbi:GerW family sporulation protein [Microaerobacter geothermalis]|uniref:GerW family sporulation protein n=1 Tax=Microaerobacter geothermalis TaxID=674972 RepID=UPI001F29C8EC|nr:GerW family sporulation protein [Microaerobacter geothermalis]MCF6094040.1 GerW family sporulation protein [Microaerobacter geothermalis]